jgi:hypothetical protein
MKSLQKIVGIIVLSAGCVLLGQSSASADTLFNVTGTYAAPTTGTFAGTITVNTDTGVLDAVNITLGSYAPFTTISNSEPSGTDAWGISATDGLNLTFFIKIDTQPNAVSLVGLTSGTIVDGAVLESLPTGVRPLYEKLSGSITPVVSTPNVPEPSSLALLTLGALAFLPFHRKLKSGLKRQG